jgi:hypothetical protein
MVKPPLGLGIIVGVIITGKFIYRWQATKQFAKGAKTVDKIKDSSRITLLDDKFGPIKNTVLIMTKLRLRTRLMTFTNSSSRMFGILENLFYSFFIYVRFQGSFSTGSQSISSPICCGFLSLQFT